MARTPWKVERSTIPVGVSIDRELLTRLNAAARKAKVTRSRMLMRALEAGLHVLETRATDTAAVA